MLHPQGMRIPFNWNEKFIWRCLTHKCHCTECTSLRVLYALAADAVEGTRRLSRVKCIQQWHGHKRCIYSRDSKTIALIKLFANGETFPSILIYLSADLREKKNAWHSESDFFFLVSFLFAAATPAMVIIRCDEQIFE